MAAKTRVNAESPGSLIIQNNAIFPVRFVCKLDLSDTSRDTKVKLTLNHQSNPSNRTYGSVEGALATTTRGAMPLFIPGAMPPPGSKVTEEAKSSEIEQTADCTVQLSAVIPSMFAHMGSVQD